MKDEEAVRGVLWCSQNSKVPEKCRNGFVVTRLEAKRGY